MSVPAPGPTVTTHADCVMTPDEQHTALALLQRWTLYVPHDTESVSPEVETDRLLAGFSYRTTFRRHDG